VTGDRWGRGLLAAAAMSAASALLVGCAVSRSPATLRVCADPNNLPFSNSRGEGFENRLAAMLAQDLGTLVEYSWWAQRRGFVRHTLGAGSCDVIMGLPAGLGTVETTRPYYRSTYVFVSRLDRELGLHSLEDERLKHLRIGVQLVGDDFANSPPAHALSARGIVRNVVGYSVLGDYSQPNPPARIVDAVAAGDIDVALVWGPLAGYFAQRQPVAVEVSRVTPDMDTTSRPFAFDISMGVRHGDAERRRLLEDFILRRRAEIDRVLAEYGVPRLDVPGSQVVR
jgi:mxaJ protein